MAVTRHSSFDRTVNTIADRNALLNKVNHMTVLVKDAISDPDAGSGKATYRYDSSDESWILISKSKTETISFDTEELTIVDGKVIPSNIILDNKIWGIQIIQGDLIFTEPRMEELIIDYTGISGLSDYNGMKVRFTYAYGTSVAQYSTLVEDVVNLKLAGVDLTVDMANIYTKIEVDTKITNLIGGAPAALDTLKEISDQLANDESATAAIVNGLSEKQDILVSGTSIKTINGQSILGTGDIIVASSGGFGQTAAEVLAELDTI